MNDLLTGLNGGNVPALELIFMITLWGCFHPL